MRGSIRSWLALVAALLVIASCVGIIAFIHAAPEPKVDRSSLAGEWQGYLAVASIAITLLGVTIAWWRHGRRTSLDNDPVRAAEILDRAADRLALQTLRHWQRAAHQWGLTDPTPIDIVWSWNSKRSLPAGELFPSGAADDPVRKSVLTLYQDVWTRLIHNRLVVLGDAGAGKSGALVTLLLNALERRQAISSKEARSHVPTPALVTLGAWRPGEQPLVEYVADVLSRDYLALRGFGRDVAQRLVEDGRVELLLDGLDEIPLGARAEALACIDRETPGMRLALASRTKDYLKASEDSQLAHAAVIDLAPVDTATARSYLTQGHSSPEVRKRWQTFIDAFDLHPSSAIEKALRSPFVLSLIRATYSGSQAEDLDELTHLTYVREVKKAVIGAFLVVAYPDERERKRAVHWLGWVAKQAGHDRDLRWWDVPKWVPEERFRLAARWVLCVTGAVTGAFALAIGGEHKAKLAIGTYVLGGLASAVILGVLMGVTFGLIFTPALMQQRTLSKLGPMRLAVRWPGRGDLGQMLAIGAVFAALLVATEQITFVVIAHIPSSNHVFGPGSGVLAVVGFGVGSLGGLIGLWTELPESLDSATPLIIYRSEMVASTFAPLIIASMICIGEYMIAMARVPTSEALLRAIGAAAISVPLFWLVWSNVSATKLSEIILVATHRRPVSFLRLFENALSRQILRQAGAVYQFRHAELQDHLAALSQRAATRSEAIDRP